MTIQFNVGNFLKRTTTGDQSVTGVGFTPKLVLISPTWDFDPFGGSFFSDSAFYLGAAADTTASNQKSYMFYNNDADDPSDLDAGFNSAGIMIDRFPSSTVLIAATLTALGSDGFTLNYSVNDGNDFNVIYTAIGGDDITDTKVGQFTAPSSTGTDAITGVGFQPDFVMLLGTNITSDNAGAENGSYSLGYFNSNGEEAVSSVVMEDNVTTTDTARYQVTDACLAMFDPADTATITHEAAFSSMDSDGFTLNYSTASIANKRVWYAAIKGISTKIGTITSPVAGSPPISQATTGVGFQPKGIFFQSVGNTVSSSIADHARFSYGRGDASANRIIGWFGDQDASGSVVNATRFDDDAIIRVSDEATSAGSSTTQALADLSSFDSDGFTLSWSARDTNAYETIYVAFGDAPAVEEETIQKRSSVNMAMAIKELMTTTTKKRYSHATLVS